MGRKFMVGVATLSALAALVLGLSACSTGGRTGGGGSVDNAPTAIKPGQVGFQEFSIGEAKESNGIIINPVYFQAVDMEPKETAGIGGEGDLHIEADIKAIKGNKTGFGMGEFVPYLKVDYTIESMTGGQEQKGTMMPMNASDGPHYGANIKIGGAGQYKVTFVIQSPEKMAYLLHVDKTTGVSGRFWKKPLEVSWDWNYLPLKK